MTFYQPTFTPPRRVNLRQLAEMVCKSGKEETILYYIQIWKKHPQYARDWARELKVDLDESQKEGSK